MLDKPVISFKNISKNILAELFKISELKSLINNNLSLDPFKNSRKIIFDNYHPYKDGRSTIRVINSLDDYIKRHGVPNYRKLSLYRKIKIFLKFGFNN